LFFQPFNRTNASTVGALPRNNTKDSNEGLARWGAKTTLLIVEREHLAKQQTTNNKIQKLFRAYRYNAPTGESTMLFSARNRSNKSAANTSEYKYP
jgi:hypothetical protein